MGKSFKGQMTITNLVIFIMVFILYFTFAVPVLNPMIADTIATMESTPNQYTVVVVTLLNLTLFFFLMAILISVYHYAIPRREGY